MLWRGEWHPVEPIEARRRKESQRIPPLSPRIADAGVALENHERPTQPLQMIAGRQPSLSAANDDGLDPLHVLCAMHAVHSLPSSPATPNRFRVSSFPPSRSTRSSSV